MSDHYYKNQFRQPLEKKLMAGRDPLQSSPIPGTKRCCIGRRRWSISSPAKAARNEPRSPLLSSTPILSLSEQQVMWVQP
jgi:hypothetical protein